MTEIGILSRLFGSLTPLLYIHLAEAVFRERQSGHVLGALLIL